MHDIRKLFRISALGLATLTPYERLFTPNDRPRRTNEPKPSKWTGSDLRAIRKHNGVGRPTKTKRGF